MNLTLKKKKIKIEKKGVVHKSIRMQGFFTFLRSTMVISDHFCNNLSKIVTLLDTIIKN